MDEILIPAGEARAEIRVSNSEFIASTAPAFSVEEAREFIQRIRQEFPQANHHVPAFLIGHGNSVIAHCSDDGEPSGTAGKPALAVLSGSGLGDVVVVITRFFGGTKLGTGGLVRAYGDAVREALAVLPRARKVATHTIMFVVEYTHYKRATMLIEQIGAKILDQDFAADVTITAMLPVEKFEEMESGLIELTAGSTRPEIIETNPETIMPL